MRDGIVGGIKLKKVIVTGSTSMIGIALVEELLRQDIEKIYAIVRPNSQRISRLPKNSKIEVIECDINNYKMLSELISERCDTFFHIAWGATGASRNKSVMYQSNNITYTIEALHAAKKTGCVKFVGTGSQAEYGVLNLEKIGPTTTANPIQAYGVAKYAAGKLALIEAERLEIDCIWTRVFSVYGKYDKDSSMITISIKKMLTNEPTAYTEGTQLWDYLYSADAGRALYLIGEKSTGKKVYCLGSGKTKELREFIEIMKNSIDPQIEMGLGKIPYNNQSIKNLCADISDIIKDTGWEPETSFEEGIKKTICFMRGNDKIQ